MSYLIVHIVDSDELLSQPFVIVWMKYKIKKLNILKYTTKKEQKLITGKL